MRLLTALKRIMLIIGIISIVSALGIMADGLSDNISKCDVGIVLGSNVTQDGKPSDTMMARLDKAAELYRQGMFGAIIVSSDIDKYGFDEAKVMKDYLVAHHIPPKAIIMDNQGVNTAATGRDSAAIMQKHGFRSAMAITQYFHIYRTKMALRHNGITEIYNAHANLFELRDIYSIVRELAAIPVYWWRYNLE